MKSAHTGGHTAFLSLLCLPGSTNSITLGGGRLAILSLKEPMCTTTKEQIIINNNLLLIVRLLHLEMLTGALQYQRKKNYNIERNLIYLNYKLL